MRFIYFFFFVAVLIGLFFTTDTFEELQLDIYFFILKTIQSKEFFWICALLVYMLISFAYWCFLIKHFPEQMIN